MKKIYGNIHELKFLSDAQIQVTVIVPSYDIENLDKGMKLHLGGVNLVQEEEHVETSS